MKTAKSIGIALIAWCCCATAFAQTSFKKWEYNVYAGYNLGGTTPLPLPAEIRSINSWKPGFTPTLAFQVTRWLNPEWGLSSSINIDIKGMVINADVKYWNTSLVIGEGEQTGLFSGTFSGKNKTTLKNGYITVPVLATYRPFERWTFYAGGYVSFLQDAKFEGSASDGYIRSGGPTGDRINIEEATYDFSDEMKKIDAGLMVSADWRFASRMGIKANLAWGLVPIFPSDFNGISYKMYNIYFMIGLAYQL